MLLYQSGALTARINTDPKKVNGLAGITLGTYVYWFCFIPWTVLTSPWMIEYFKVCRLSSLAL